ncbi:Dbl homology domain-containing protein [Thamnocephalis sphaerospora]|uniref:Dbl homology domain-containing protein n=1 Tax=Thamnocephalis sphaerospora TaxID=78915 RepID=A0A4V1IX88_9FUNG|nr:Dbl homology domain-containing protein [Thamnocephalis sphaerospora]|eukprot:RKP10209.1 Dbl homology domain-containing protein [Thamnocephalis sphaerospora]
MEQRQNIALEILETERTYVSRLTFLLEQFRDPLLKIVDTPARILTAHDIKEIFQHLDAILKFHRELLQRLESRINVASWNPVQGCLGDIFLLLAPYFKIYNLYLGNCTHAMERVSAHMGASPAFVLFLRETDKRQKNRGLTLQAYLLEPMQRIPRYRLLLASLMKKTAIGHPDHHQLQDALAEVEKVALFVNEALRRHDEAKLTLDIQRSLNGFSGRLLVPGRHLVKRGSVKKICRRNHQRREFFLFSDILIYASPGLMEDAYIFHRKLPLEYCKVVSVPDNEAIQNGFQILSPDKSFQVYTDTAEEKQAWIGALCEAISERREAQQTLRKEKKVRPQLDSYKLRIVDEYNAPVWVPDDDAAECMICQQEFRLYRRKHHCRLCGKVVCHACSSRNFLIPGETEEEDRVERACDPCFRMRWGDADADDDEDTVMQAMRLRSLTFVAAPGIASRITRVRTALVANDHHTAACLRCSLCTPTEEHHLRAACGQAVCPVPQGLYRIPLACE